MTTIKHELRLAAGTKTIEITETAELICVAINDVAVRSPELKEVERFFRKSLLPFEGDERTIEIRGPNGTGRQYWDANAEQWVLSHHDKQTND